MAQFINCSICVSDIPKESIKRANNGKAYLNIVVVEKKEVDAYGNTHYLAISQTKEEREAQTKRVYIGDGKAYQPAPSTPTAEEIDNLPPIEEYSDLPF